MVTPTNPHLRRGGFVCPGGVDAHVHLAQDLNTGPSSSSLGGSIADDFETGSRSAVCGGTTTLIAFAAQTRDDKSLLKVVEDYYAVAESTGSFIDYGFHIIITSGDKEMLATEFPLLRSEWGITSCKLFLTYVTMKLTDYELLDVFYEARKHSVTTVRLPPFSSSRFSCSTDTRFIFRWYTRRTAI